MITLNVSAPPITDGLIVYGGVCRMRYTIAWCTKHRRNVRIEPAAMQQLTPLFSPLVGEADSELRRLDIRLSWIRCEVEFTSPHISPAQLIHHIKSTTSVHIRRHYPDIRRRLKSLWARSFLMATAEHASDKQMAVYVAGQGSR
jgi:putative transposase